MTPDLDRAIEQFDAAMGGNIHGYERADDMSVQDIVEALLAAGWRPPYLQDPCQFCGTPVQTDTEDDDMAVRVPATRGRQNRQLRAHT